MHKSLCILQENGLVPIVEPEVTLGPGDYDIETTAFWSERVYSHVFRCDTTVELRHVGASVGCGLSAGT